MLTRLGKRSGASYRRDNSPHYRRMRFEQTREWDNNRASWRGEMRRMNQRKRELAAAFLDEVASWWELRAAFRGLA